MILIEILLPACQVLRLRSSGLMPPQYTVRVTVPRCVSLFYMNDIYLTGSGVRGGECLCVPFALTLTLALLVTLMGASAAQLLHWPGNPTRRCRRKREGQFRVEAATYELCGA